MVSAASLSRRGQWIVSLPGCLLKSETHICDAQVADRSEETLMLEKIIIKGQSAKSRDVHQR